MIETKWEQQKQDCKILILSCTSATDPYNCDQSQANTA